MLTVGAFKAKTHLSSLLDRVAQGEEIVITRHGKAVARLVPDIGADRTRVDDAVSAIKTLRMNNTLDGLSWRDLRDEGRR
jgi:prevent-host-death family protein